MFKKLILSASFLLATHIAFSQGVAINEDNSSADGSAILDVKSTTKGLLIPRLTQTQRDAIATPATGLMVYQTDGTAGFYYYNGTAWIAVVTPVSPSWGLTGNAGTTAGTNFIGNTDNTPLVFKVNNINAGYISGATNNYNTTFGYGTRSINFANTAIGYNALISTTLGGNTALGAGAFENGKAFRGVAIGNRAGLNMSGGYNIAIGYDALFSSNLPSNNTGSGNVAIGAQALNLTTTGSNNVAVGYDAGKQISTGSNNIAIGNNAQVRVATANNQVRIGNDAITTTDLAGQLTYNAQSTTTSNTFPNDRGTNGQVLTTDGAGQLSWATMAGGGSGVVLDLVVTKTAATQTPSIANGTNTGDVIVFDNVVNTPTVGTYSTTTNTYTVGQSGLYYIQVRSVSADNTPVNNTVGHWFKVEITPNGGTPSFINDRDIYGVYPMISAINFPSGLKGRSELSGVVYLNTGDSFVIKGLSANSVATSPIKNDGSCKLTVVKLN